MRVQADRGTRELPAAPPGRGRRPWVVGLLVVVLVLGLVTVALVGLRAGTRAPVADQDREPAPAAPAVAPAPAPAPSPAPTPPPPRRLAITSHPEGAAVAITTAAGTTHTGQTPFDAVVEGGPAEVTLTLAGHNPLTRRVDLQADTAVDWWLDPEGLLHHKVAEFTTGSAPKQVAFSPDGTQLWTSLLAGTGLDVFDPLTGQLLGQVDMGAGGAVEVIFSADGTTVWASQMETASVFEIDRASLTVRRRLDSGGVDSKVIALSPDESTLYVSNWSSDDIGEIDLATGQVRRLLPTVATPRGLYPSPDGSRLYVAGFDGGELAVIDLATGASRTLLRTGGAMRHLVGHDGLLYANDMGTNEAYVVDTATDQVRTLAATNDHPNTADLTPDGRVLYVSNRGRNNPETYYLPGPEWGSVLAIDTATGAVLDAIVGGNQTTGLDVSPDGRLLAFSDFLDDRIQIFEIPPTPTLLAGNGGRAQAHRAELEKP